MRLLNNRRLQPLPFLHLLHATGGQFFTENEESDSYSVECGQQQYTFCPTGTSSVHASTCSSRNPLNLRTSNSLLHLDPDLHFPHPYSTSLLPHNPTIDEQYYDFSPLLVAPEVSSWTRCLSHLSARSLLPEISLYLCEDV